MYIERVIYIDDVESVQICGPLGHKSATPVRPPIYRGVGGRNYSYCSMTPKRGSRNGPHGVPPALHTIQTKQEIKSLDSERDRSGQVETGRDRTGQDRAGQDSHYNDEKVGRARPILGARGGCHMRGGRSPPSVKSKKFPAWHYKRGVLSYSQSLLIDGIPGGNLSWLLGQVEMRLRA